MTAQIIDGKEVAKSVRRSLNDKIASLAEQGVVPGLAAVLIGEDPASQVYVGSKAKACQKLKLHSEVIKRHLI